MYRKQIFRRGGKEPSLPFRRSGKTFTSAAAAAAADIVLIQNQAAANSYHTLFSGILMICYTLHVMTI